MSKNSKKRARRAERESNLALGTAPQNRSAGKKNKQSLASDPLLAEDITLQRGSFTWIVAAKIALITGLVFFIYYSVLHGRWLWDDDYLIANNELIHSPDGLLEIWFNPASLIDFFPLTVSVIWLEWQLWPNDPFIYHLTSVILHIISSLLIWLLFRKLGLRLAWLGGLLFAVHPAMVESVAWMAELKNTLAMPPFLLAACAWVDFERTRKSHHYYLALALFLIAMLCKSTMVMFPFLIFLYAWWRHGKVGWVEVKQSIPFFATSLVLGLILIALLRHGVGEELTPLGNVFTFDGFMSRVACGGLSLSFYFSKAVMPFRLYPIYPQWIVMPPSLAQFLPWPVLAFALGYLWTKRNTWGRHILFGFGFFIVNLLPFVGFRMISFMRFTWVMDHFLYIPILGILGLVVAAMSQLDLRFSAETRPLRIAALVAVIATLTISGHFYARIFVNQYELWTYTIRNNSGAWPAFNNLGNVLSDMQRLDEAEDVYKEALVLNPYYPEAHNNLGRVYAATGRPYQALAEFHRALELCPELASAQMNLQAIQQALTMQAFQNDEPPKR